MPAKEMTYADERRTVQLADQAGREISWNADDLADRSPGTNVGRRPRAKKRR